MGDKTKMAVLDSSGTARPGIGAWLPQTLLLAWSVLILVPWYPPIECPGALLDTGWNFVLSRAYTENLVWGRDVVFAYGPWSFLTGVFTPATYPAYLAIWIGVAAATGVILWLLSARLASPYLRLGWAACAVVLLVSGGASAFFLAMVGLLPVLLMKQQRHPVLIGLLPLVAALASLVKSSWLIAAVPLIVLLSVEQIVWQRKWPTVAGVYAAGVVLFWLLAGQPLSALFDHIRWSIEVAGGYSEAMSQEPPPALLTLAYVVVALGLGALLVHLARGQRQVLLAVGVLWVLLVNYKAGYVRYDAVHVAIACGTLLALAAAWPVAIASSCPPGRMVAYAVSALVAITLFSQLDRHTTNVAVAGSVNALTLANVRENWRLPPLGTRHTEFLRKVRRDNPLPALAESTDIYSYGQILLFAHEIPYRNRPVFQSYSAYTESLAQLNAAFLRSPRAPQNILLCVELVDGRYPGLDDGLSWPELLTRYDVTAQHGDFLQLKRAEVPRTWSKELLLEHKSGVGETVLVPQSATGPIWVEIDLHQTLAGKISGFINRPPRFAMEVTTADGRMEVYLLVASLSRAGFLLSPVVNSSSHLFSLQEMPSADRIVRSIRISTVEPGMEPQEIPMRFYRFVVQDAARP